ncbi:MAG: two-component regulator propeller domain-containing protein, partial [Saprospiraceae bacterium]
MKNQTYFRFLFILCIVFISCKEKDQSAIAKVERNQLKSELSNIFPPIATVDTTLIKNAPSAITRNIIEDSHGNIWFATFAGVIKYDGATFTNVTAGVSESRFFSILEDKKGNLW